MNQSPRYCSVPLYVGVMSISEFYVNVPERAWMWAPVPAVVWQGVHGKTSYLNSHMAVLMFLDEQSVHEIGPLLDSRIYSNTNTLFVSLQGGGKDSYGVSPVYEARYPNLFILHNEGHQCRLLVGMMSLSPNDYLGESVMPLPQWSGISLDIAGMPYETSSYGDICSESTWRQYYELLQGSISIQNRVKAIRQQRGPRSGVYLAEETEPMERVVIDLDW